MSMVAISLKPLICGSKIMHVSTVMLICNSSVHSISIYPVFIFQGIAITFVNICPLFFSIWYSDPCPICVAWSVSQRVLMKMNKFNCHYNVNIIQTYYNVIATWLRIEMKNYLQISNKNEICLCISGFK